MNPIIKKPNDEEIKKAQNWPIWEKEISEFDWEYIDDETCLILEGEITITNENGENFKINKGDWVVFPKGMKCKWNISKNVRKYYRIG
jgi:uncharacterized cupin superfamily protein